MKEISKGGLFLVADEHGEKSLECLYTKENEKYKFLIAV